MSGEFSLYKPAKNIMLDAFPVLYDGEYHIFYTQQPTDFPFDYAMRSGSIGHAVSNDLFHWNECSVAVSPGEAKSFDERAVWIGSIFEYNKRFYMFYTAHCGEVGNFPNIGVAYSNDLYNWKKINKAIFSPDNSKWYVCSRDLGGSGWRDPFVFQLRDQLDVFYLAFAGRLKTQQKYNAVIGLARSKNLIDWELLEPLYDPGIYEAMDVPHILITDKGNFLMFYVNESWIGERARDFLGRENVISGTHCIADSSRLEFRKEDDNYIIVGNSGTANDLVIRSFIDRSGNLSSLSFLFDRLNSDDGVEAGGRLSPPRLFTINRLPTLRIHPDIVQRFVLLEPICKDVWDVNNNIFAIEIKDEQTDDVKLVIKSKRDEFERTGYLIYLNRVNQDIEIIRQIDRKIIFHRPLTLAQAHCRSIQLICWNNWLEIFLDNKLSSSSRVYRTDGNTITISGLSAKSSTKVYWVKLNSFMI